MKEVSSDKIERMDFIIKVVSLYGLLRVVCKFFGDSFLLEILFCVVSLIFISVKIVDISFMIYVIFDNILIFCL